jgi:hypothetical protein
MRAGEVIETTAPGRTAPESSRTVPSRVPVVICADAGVETRTDVAIAKTVRNLKDLIAYLAARLASETDRPAGSVLSWTEQNAFQRGILSKPLERKQFG